MFFNSAFCRIRYCDDFNSDFIFTRPVILNGTDPVLPPIYRSDVLAPRSVPDAGQIRGRFADRPLPTSDATSRQVMRAARDTWAARVVTPDVNYQIRCANSGFYRRLAHHGKQLMDQGTRLRCASCTMMMASWEIDTVLLEPWRIGLFSFSRAYFLLMEVPSGDAEFCAACCRGKPRPTTPCLACKTGQNTLTATSCTTCSTPTMISSSRRALRPGDAGIHPAAPPLCVQVIKMCLAARKKVDRPHRQGQIPAGELLPAGRMADTLDTPTSPSRSALPKSCSPSCAPALSPPEESDTHTW